MTQSGANVKTTPAALLTYFDANASIPSTQVTGLGTFATQNYATPPAIGGTTPAAVTGTVIEATNYNEVVATAPCDYLDQSGAGTNLGWWGTCVNSGVWSLATYTDALGAGLNAMTVTRGTTTNITNLSFGNTTNNPTYTFLGSGGATFGGTLTSTGQISSNASLSISGTSSCGGSTAARFHLTATGTIAWCLSNNTDAFSVSSTVDTFNGTTFTVPNATTIAMASLTSSTAAQTGSVCWSSSTLTYDPSSTCLVSARRFKHDIKPLAFKSGLDEVMALNPVSYFMNEDGNVDLTNAGEQVGFVAEEVQAVDPRLVTLEEDGQVHTVRYMQMTAVLTKAIQDQQHEIAALALWSFFLTGYVIIRRK
jgi:hypothetical protein